MIRSPNRHSPPKTEEIARFSVTALEVEFVAATPEDRHSAVCEGAIKHLPDLRAFARALTSNGHQADDLVQTTIMRALAAAEQFTPGTNFKAWSFTILRNAFYNNWRSPISREVMLDDGITATAATAPTQEAFLEACDFRRAFAQLVPDHREALLLIGASGLTYEEAAKVCNCAAGTMKSRASRARTALKAIMDGGALNLLRSDVMPISALDLAIALETDVVVDNLHRRSAAMTLRENHGTARAGLRSGV